MRHRVGGEIDATGSLQRQRKGQHADNKNQALPVDRGIGTVEIHAAQQPHQQAADQNRVHVRHHTADHHTDRQSQHRQSLRCEVRGRQNLFVLGR